MLEAVITCVGYSDYLAHTLPLTVKWFDRVKVVSSAEDYETARVCSQYGSTIEVVTDEFKRDGAVFRKGAGINAGLRELKREGWVVHLDADTALLDPPPLDSLDPTCLYGAQRYRVKGHYRFQRLLRDHDITEGSPPVGDLVKVPILRNALGELSPSGYFQMWHWPTCSHFYDTTSPHAGHSDWRFLAHWPEERRKIHENYKVFHLEMQTDKKTINWKGRRSVPFA